MLKNKNIAKAMAAATVLTAAAPMTQVFAAEQRAVVDSNQTEEIKALKEKVYELLNAKYTTNYNLLVEEKISDNETVSAQELAGSKVYDKITVTLDKDEIDVTNYAAFEKEFDKLYSELKNGKTIILEYSSKYNVRELEDGQLVNSVNAVYETIIINTESSEIDANLNTTSGIAKDIMTYLEADVVTNTKEDNSQYAKIPVSNGYITVVKGDDKLDLNKPKFKVVDGYYVDANGNSIKKFEANKECLELTVTELIALGGVIEGYYPVVKTPDEDIKDADTIAIVKNVEAAQKEELTVGDLYEAEADRLTVKGNEFRKFLENAMNNSEDNLRVIVKLFDKAGEQIEIENNENNIETLEEVVEYLLLNSEEIEELFDSIESMKWIVEESEDETVDDCEWIPVYEATITEGRNEDFNNLLAALTGQTEILMRAGMDRYETAVEASKKEWTGTDADAIKEKDGYKSIILVSGDNEKLVDGLAATPLAAVYNAPVLLTSSNEIPKVVMDEIERLQKYLGVNKITIVGGTSGVSEAIETKLEKTYGLEVERLSGDDRYETSMAVANKMAQLNQINATDNQISENEKFDQVFLVGGDGEADALSISAVAGIKESPILLTPANELNSDVKTFIQNYVNDKNDDADVYIVGGTNSVNTSVQNKLVDVSIFSNNNKVEVKRLAGIDRQETNAAVINEFAKMNSGSDNNAWKFVVANSSNASMVDALAAGAVAAHTNSHIVLADEKLTESQEDALKEVNSTAWKSRQIGYKVSTSVAKFVADLVKKY